MASFVALVADQVFPDVDIESELIAAAGGVLRVASDPDEAYRLSADADAVITTYLPFDAAAVAQLRRARIIARYGIGVDNIDVPAARARGIAVTNVPDYCIEEVATHTLGFILGLVRRIPAGDALVRE